MPESPAHLLRLPDRFKRDSSNPACSCITLCHASQTHISLLSVSGDLFPVCSRDPHYHPILEQSSKKKKVREQPMMARKGQKVARKEEGDQSTKSSPTKAQQPVQATGEWLEQALLWRSCPGDHIPCAVLAREVPKPTPADLCSPCTLVEKVQL